MRIRAQMRMCYQNVLAKQPCKSSLAQPCYTAPKCKKQIQALTLLPRTDTIPEASTRAGSDLAFRSLVERSIAAWESTKSTRGKKRAIKKHSRLLRSLETLDDFLAFRDQQYWFFQLRKAFLRQEAFEKWSPDRLDDYILLPIEDGFANPNDCIFLSHFWHEPENPYCECSDLKPIQ